MDAGVEAFFYGFAVEVIDESFDAEVSHFQRILDDEAVDLAGAESGDEFFGGVESDELYMTGVTAALQGAQHAEGGGFVGREDAVDLKMSCVGGGAEREEHL